VLIDSLIDLKCQDWIKVEIYKINYMKLTDDNLSTAMVA